MTAYKIKASSFCAAIVVAGPTVIQAPPVLEPYVCGSFEDLRSACEQRGWVIEPILSEMETEWIEHEGKLYELVYDGPKQLRLLRITVHEDGEANDISARDLPYPLGLML